MFAETAWLGAKKCRAVGQVGGGLPSDAVFGETPLLNQVGSGVTAALLGHDVIHFVLVSGAAARVVYRKPTDGCFSGLHGGISGAVFDKERNVEDIMT